MLTFFEYLRQRAYESVLCGAQEALESLERQGAFAKPPAAIASRPQANRQAALSQTPHELAEGSPNTNTVEAHAPATRDEGETLPAPRLRSRPNRKGSRKR